MQKSAKKHDGKTYKSKTNEKGIAKLKNKIQKYRFLYFLEIYLN